MKQVIQLEIPFAADEPQSSVAVTPTRVDTAELRMLATVRKAAAAVKSALPMAILFVQIAAAVVGGFALMFLAAILQG